MSNDVGNLGTHVTPVSNTLRRRLAVITGFIALVLIALTAPIASSHFRSDDPKAIPIGNLSRTYPFSNLDLKDVQIDDLKNDYLSCSRAAMNGQLDSAGIMRCSIVYEVLKQQAFGGDFDKLLDWSRAHPLAEDAGQ